MSTERRSGGPILSRKHLLALGAAFAIGAAIEGPRLFSHSSSQQSEGSKPKENPNFLPMADLVGMEKDAPNKEFIVTQAENFLKKPPGGYDLPLRQSDTPSPEVQLHTNIAHDRNVDGIDDRSIAEVAMFAALEMRMDNDENVHPNVREKLLQKNPELASKIDTTLGSQDWATDETPGIGDILLGLQAAGSIRGREKGTDLFWRMLQHGKLRQYGVEPMDDPRINWALKTTFNKVYLDPTALAFTRIARPIAINILKAAPERFFDALSPQDANQRVKQLEEDVMNPGTLVGLEMQETGFQLDDGVYGFVFIGDVPWMTQINTAPNEYPTSFEDMKYVADYLNRVTGLPYNSTFTDQFGETHHVYAMIPGSNRGGLEQNSSGGATFGQLMPPFLRKFIENIEYAREQLAIQNVFIPDVKPGDPIWMAVMQYAYINGQWWSAPGLGPNDYKGGYIAGKRLLEKHALKSWNWSDLEAETSLDFGVSYYNHFGKH